MKSKHFQIPESQDAFLAEILGSIKKRSKSLNYNTQELSVDRVFEELEESRIEKIEVKLKTFYASLSICIWQDRWVTISCGVNTKANKWSWFYEGKYLPLLGGKDMVTAIERTFGDFYQMSDKRKNHFETIWKPLLARKLEVVK